MDCVISLLLLSHQVVVFSLFRALPSIWNVSMFISIFYLIFSILAVSLFKGRFQGCSISLSPYELPLDKTPCLLRGGTWGKLDENFNFDSALWLLVWCWRCIPILERASLFVARCVRSV